MKTKDKILKTALHLFAQQGIHKTSTTAITKKIGLSSGALFVHFKTKNDLIHAVYDMIHADVCTLLQENFVLRHPPENVIHSFSRAVFDYFSSHKDEFVFLELVNHHVPLYSCAHVALEKEYTLIEDVFQRWQTQGDIRNMDVRLLYTLFWNLLSTFICSFHAGRIQKLDDHHLDVLWDLVRR